MIGLQHARSASDTPSDASALQGLQFGLFGIDCVRVDTTPTMFWK
jgi:hypothetical protein